MNILLPNGITVNWNNVAYMQTIDPVRVPDFEHPDFDWGKSAYNASQPHGWDKEKTRFYFTDHVEPVEVVDPDYLLFETINNYLREKPDTEFLELINFGEGA